MLEPNKMLRKIALYFLLFGIVGGILIAFVSTAAYGRIYFFDGYFITGLLWVICFLFILIGALLFISTLDGSEKFASVFTYIIIGALLIGCLCFLVKCTGDVFGGGSSNGGSEWTVCHKCGGDGKVTNDLGFNVSCPRCDGVGYLPY